MPYKGDHAIKAELVRSGDWITPFQQGGAWEKTDLRLYSKAILMLFWSSLDTLPNALIG